MQEMEETIGWWLGPSPNGMDCEGCIIAYFSPWNVTCPSNKDKRLTQDSYHAKAKLLLREVT